jgi:flavin reductase (DIM6/NTAB) family NADH-FMN oxidoreductase RutF
LAKDLSELDPAARKAVLRLVSYGMYVVGVSDGEDANVFTANWLTQVSFDPPLLALSVEKGCRSDGIIGRSRRFAVSFLASGQRQVAADLGKSSASVPDKLGKVSHRLSANRCPVLEDALAYVACEVVSMTPAGDSNLYIAEVVEAVSLREGEPLTMRDAGFRHAG